jgi:hypothetical protein
MIKGLRKHIWPAIFIACAPAVFPVSADLRVDPVFAAPRSAPVDVVKAYLQAIHARDFDAAYPYISSADRRVRDKQSYLRSQQSLSGFALQLASRLSADMEVWLIKERSGPNRALVEIGYRLPSGDEIAGQLLDWNSDKLNALSAKEQSAIVEALGKSKKSGKMITVEGRETFDLVLEKQGWKIFEDWRSRQRVLFQSAQPKPATLEVKFLRNDMLVKGEEPFQVDLEVINQTHREVWVTVKHSFAPRRIEKNIDMIVCGSLVPFRLGPRETREISSAYILRGSVPAKTPVSIIYDVIPASGTTARQSFVTPK